MVPLLTTSQVARLLAVSQRSIRLWAECGELRGIKIGRQWRFRSEVVQKWLAERELAEKNILFPIQSLRRNSAITESAANGFRDSGVSFIIGKSRRA